MQQSRCWEDEPVRVVCPGHAAGRSAHLLNDGHEGLPGRRRAAAVPPDTLHLYRGQCLRWNSAGTGQLCRPGSRDCASPHTAPAGCGRLFFPVPHLPPPPCPLKVKKCLKPPEFLSCALWCELGSERLHLGSQLWPHPLDPGQAPSQTRVHTLQALLPSDGSPSVSVVVPENQGLCGGDSAFVSLVHSLSSLGTGTSEEYQLFILLVRVPGNREIRAPGVGTTGGTVISAKICRGRGAHAQFPPLLPPW